MTKHVRIEDADTNDSVRVVIITEDQVYDSVADAFVWRESNRETLCGPCAMTGLGTYLTSTRRLRIEEQLA